MPVTRLLLSAFLLSLLAAPAFARFDFALRRHLPAGTDPSGTVVGDFDRDGHYDFAVTERGVDSVSVWFGDGKGKFGSRDRYPTGDYPSAIATGDINGDGRLDLAIVNGVSNTLTIYRGMALGAFGARTDYATGLTPLGLAIGDANNDAHPDVIVANSVSHSMTVFTGGSYGVGVAGESYTIPTGTGPRGVAIGDLDLDGVNDLLTANAGTDSVSVFKGVAAGGYGPRTDLHTANQPVALSLGDVDRNGSLDLAVVSVASSYVHVFLNVGGILVPGQFYAAGDNPNSVRIGDFDGDTTADIAVGHATSAMITFLGGGGNGVFTIPFNVAAGGSGVGGFGTADLDGDGARDLVVPCLSPPVASVLLSFGEVNGFGQFRRVDRPAATSPAGVVASDLTGDGHVDFAVTNNGSASITTYVNDGNGAFAGRVDVPAPLGPNFLAAADFNGDAKPDLAMATYAAGGNDSNRVSVFLNQGSGVFNARTDYEVTLGIARMGLGVGDVTDDGQLDLVTGHQNTTLARILAGNGTGGFVVAPSLTTYNSPTSIDLADADGNGSLDVFVGGAASFFEGLVCVFMADGAGGFLPRVDYPVIEWPSAIVHGDFDEDGDLDLAVANQGAGQVSILRGDGQGAFTNIGTISIPGAYVTALAVADINLDGDLDVVCGRGTSNLAVLYGRGDGTFSLPSHSSTPGAQAALAVGFLDGNATPDIVTANQNTANASVLLNKARTKTTLTVTPNPTAVGQSITFQATVTSALPDSSDPTGQVRFFDGETDIGLEPLVGGVATLVVPGAYKWDRVFSAKYLSDLRFLPSLSPTVGHFTYVPTIDVPPLAPPVVLALAPIGNPARAGSALRLRFEVPVASEPARLSLLDVRGRLLASREVSGAGLTELAPAGRLAPGVYLVRLEQGARVAVARAVVL